MSKSKWYIVHAYSNFEKKVSQSLREQAEIQGLKDAFEQIEVPTEEVIEVQRGKKKIVERRRFPGYVLIKTALTDEIYHIVKSTPKVTGFLGANGGKTPLPVPQAEVDRILGTGDGDSPAEIKGPQVIFEVGETIRVLDGPFQSFEGAVEEVDDDNGRLKASVSIFGRETPVDLEFAQVEKVD